MTWVHRRCVIDGISFLCILGLDRIAKYLALDLLSPGVPDQIGSFFGINLFWTLTYNQGAAWGMFSEFPQLLLVSRFLFIGLLSVITILSADWELVFPFGSDIPAL